MQRRVRLSSAGHKRRNVRTDECDRPCRGDPRTVAGPILLDCSLEDSEGELQTSIEISKAAGRSKILENREAQVRLMGQKFKPDFVITDKGISDYTQHFF